MCVVPGIGLIDSSESLPIQDILWKIVLYLHPACDCMCFCCETTILLCPLKPLAFCHLSAGLSCPANQQSAGLHNNSFPKPSLHSWNCCRMAAVIMPNADVQTSKASSRSEMRDNWEQLFRCICAVICLTFHLKSNQPCLWPEHLHLGI